MSAPPQGTSVPTYLERVEISNFRAYGERFVLTLPNGPGVTLISGPNGLGKTTLFDAVEWCLTGAVGRFDPYLGGAAARRPRPFTRLGAPPGSHRVSLHFGGAAPVDRGLGFEPARGEVVRLLKHPEWGDVSDLAQYLSLTHFLGQSAGQRFSVRSAKEQWEALKGPAGVDRINYFQDRIGGQATRLAFTRRVRAAEAELESAQKAAADWTAALDRLERAERLPRSVAAMPPASLVALFRRVPRALAEAGLGAETASDDGVLATPGDAQRAAASALDAARQQLAEDALRVAQLGPVVEEYVELTGAARAASDIATLEDARCRELAAEIASVAGSVASARADLETAQRGLREATRTAAALAELQGAVATVAAGTARVAECDARLTECHVRSAVLDTERGALADEVQVVERTLAARRAVASRLATCQALYASAVEAEARRRRSAEVVGDAEVTSLLQALDGRRSELARERERLLSSVTAVEKQLDERDRVAGVMAALVAELGALLTDDDRECPVCATSFPAGRLAMLARSASRTLSGDARELSDQLADARVALAALEQDSAAVMARADGLRQALRERDAAEAAERQVARGLAESGVDAPSTSPADLGATATRLEAELAEADARIAALRPLDACESMLRELDSRRSALTAQAAALRADRDGAAAAVAEAGTLLATRPNNEAREGDLASRSAAATARVREAAEQTEDRAGSVRALEESLAARRRDASDAERARDTQRRAADAAARRLAELGAAWAMAGLEGDPDGAAVLREQDRLNARGRVLGQAAEEFDRGVAGHRALADDEDRATSERETRALMDRAGVRDRAAMGEHLTREIERAQGSVARAARARELASDVAGRLQREAEAYAHSVLAPLNATINDFSQALLTRADGSLHYEAEYLASRSVLRSGVLRSTAAGKAEVLEMNPNLYFSEGQLSALSVSALLAASTTFRWSRWRALLLDDPLQHNDVIHASAFIDLIRRLVQKLNYQVILSTHDSEEAEFIARKCESASVPLRLCELRPSGTSGIVTVGA